MITRCLFACEIDLLSFLLWSHEKFGSFGRRKLPLHKRRRDYADLPGRSAPSSFNCLQTDFSAGFYTMQASSPSTDEAAELSLLQNVYRPLWAASKRYNAQKALPKKTALELQAIKDNSNHCEIEIWYVSFRSSMTPI